MPRHKLSQGWAFGARMLVGLLYGCLLYFAAEGIRTDRPLFGFEEGESWDRLSDVLRLLCWLVPIPLLLGLGRLPSLRLAIWTLGSIILLFIFGWWGRAGAWEDIDGIFNVGLFSLIVLFIIHEFLQSASDDNSRIAQYTILAPSHTYKPADV